MMQVIQSATNKKMMVRTAWRLYSGTTLHLEQCHMLQVSVDISPHQGVQEVALLHRALLGSSDLVKLYDADAAEEDEHDVDDDTDDEAHADTHTHVDLLMLCSTELSELKEGK